MYRELFPIYGPISINSFGLMIALGIILFAWLVSKNPQKKNLMSSDQFLDVLMVGLLTGIIGARALCIATDWHQLNSWHEIFQFWLGGYSVLGAIVGVACCLPFYLHYRGLQVLASLDLFALYAPLLQGVARFGCLFAGCCYGKATALPWAITYTDTGSIAPLHIPLHPTQIYSSLLLFGIFIFLSRWASKHAKRPGQILCLYLSLSGIERFFIDFLRADQEFFAGSTATSLSIYQWIALSLSIVAALFLMYLTFRTDSVAQRHLNESL